MREAGYGFVGHDGDKHNDCVRGQALGAQRHTYNDGVDRQHEQQNEDKGMWLG